MGSKNVGNLNGGSPYCCRISGKLTIRGGGYSTDGSCFNIFFQNDQNVVYLPSMSVSEFITWKHRIFSLERK